MSDSCSRRITMRLEGMFGALSAQTVPNGTQQCLAKKSKSLVIVASPSGQTVSLTPEQIEAAFRAAENKTAKRFGFVTLDHIACRAVRFWAPKYQYPQMIHTELSNGLVAYPTPEMRDDAMKTLPASALHAVAAYNIQ
jgi:hypothetical protein